MPDHEDRLYSLAELMEMYYCSVGQNRNLLLHANPGPDGLVPEPHLRRYVEFGTEIQRRFATDPGRTYTHFLHGRTKYSYLSSVRNQQNTSVHSSKPSGIHLEMRGIGKSFHGVKALKGVSLELAGEQVHSPRVSSRGCPY